MRQGRGEEEERARSRRLMRERGLYFISVPQALLGRSLAPFSILSVIWAIALCKVYTAAQFKPNHSHWHAILSPLIINSQNNGAQLGNIKAWSHTDGDGILMNNLQTQQRKTRKLLKHTHLGISHHRSHVKHTLRLQRPDDWVSNCKI